MTATHQLKTAVTSVAFAGRALFLASLSSSSKEEDIESRTGFIDLLMSSLSNALLGMDANDPPKTMATMQLIGSMFSNVSTTLYISVFLLLLLLRKSQMGNGKLATQVYNDCGPLQLIANWFCVGCPKI